MRQILDTFHIALHAFMQMNLYPYNVLFTPIVLIRLPKCLRIHS